MPNPANPTETARTLVPLYVHVPFCRRKCDYCSFFSVAPSPARIETFLRGVERECAQLAAGGATVGPTIYIGGGNPSVLPSNELDRMLATIAAITDPPAIAEWTCEANPETFDVRTASIMVRRGVNRVSFGAQSFDNNTLRRIGRGHDATMIHKAVSAARTCGLINIGLDLIAGLPGVDPHTWDETLTRACDLTPSHISVYALSLEAGTPLARAVRDGSVVLPSEESVMDALDAAEDTLATAGFHRYEISNFARPGFECIHNRSCWAGGDYIGIGPAAASRVRRQRWRNTTDIQTFEAALNAGVSPAQETEQLSETADLCERVMFAFRLLDGFNPSVLNPPEPLATAWQDTMHDLQNKGLLEQSEALWRLTRRGRLFADTVAEAFAGF